MASKKKYLDDFSDPDFYKRLAEVRKKKNKKNKKKSFDVREVSGDEELKKIEEGYTPLTTQYGYELLEPVDRDYGRHPGSIDENRIDWSSGGYVKKYAYGGRVAKSSAEKS